MKNILFTIFIIISLNSCLNKDDNSTHNKDSQHWKLIKMTGNMIDSETTGVNMSWQESYFFNTDGTFLKSREKFNILFKAKGTYDTLFLPDDTYLELTYNSNNSIIANCTADLKEILIIKSENILSGTWQACDGSGLEYKMITAH